MNKKIGIPIFIIVLVALGTTFAYLNFFSKKAVAPSPVITNFEECLAAGNPVQESFPRKCSAAGKSFTENIGNTIEKQNLIQLTTPIPNEVIKSPLKISGQARGNWFFEASFPVKILDANGKVLGTAIASTRLDWMTDNFVPFNTELTFEAATTSTGTLVLEKDNPSGLPQNADSLKIPIKFK